MLRFFLVVAWGLMLTNITASPAAAQDTKPRPGNQLPKIPAPDASAAHVAKGFDVEVFLHDLTYPTSVEFDDRGNLFVAEAGFSYGDPAAMPRISMVTPDGEVRPVAERGLEGPVNDLLWYDGRMYVAHRGKISVLDGDDLLHIVTDLPSMGDHHTNQMSPGPDGKIYFGQGTVTNSGVVGIDNYRMGWLKKHPEAHDVAPHKFAVTDAEFETRNPLSKEESDQAVTSPFQPFGKVVDAGTKIPETTKANGTVLAVNPNGSELKIYAWGFRNPFGVQWSPQGMLFVTENGMDVRGSRPIANDWEDLYLVDENGWYGWPDYCSGMPVTDQRFKPQDKPGPQFLMQEHPAVKKPYMKFSPHSAIAKMAFSPGGVFGPSGTMYVAFFGHMAPMTGTVEEHGGHRVIRVDLNGKISETFFGPKLTAARKKSHRRLRANRKSITSRQLRRHPGHGDCSMSFFLLTAGPCTSSISASCSLKKNK